MRGPRAPAPLAAEAQHAELLNSFSFSTIVEPGRTDRPTTAAFEHTLRSSQPSLTLRRAGAHAALSSSSRSPRGRSRSPTRAPRSRSPARSPARSLGHKPPTLARSPSPEAQPLSTPIPPPHAFTGGIAKEIASVRDRRWSPFRSERKLALVSEHRAASPTNSSTQQAGAPFVSTMGYTISEASDDAPAIGRTMRPRRESTGPTAASKAASDSFVSPFWSPNESQAILGVDSWLESYARERSHFRSNATWA